MNRIFTSLRALIALSAASALALAAPGCLQEDTSSANDPIAPESAASALTAGKTYRIMSVNSGLALDVYGVSKDGGAPIQQWPYWRSPNERWQLRDAGAGAFEIVSVNSGLCLDVIGVSKDPGARLQQWGCWGSANQKWRVNDAGSGAFEIVSVNSGLCLDVIGVSKDDGARLQQWGCSGGANQKWRLEEVDGNGDPVTSGGGGTTGGERYTNPVLNEDFADPAVLRASDGAYYAYSTQGPRGRIQVAKSLDLVHWGSAGNALPNRPSWASGSNNFWAPHVIQRGSTYVMYFSSDRDGASGMCVGVATASSPTGPFQPTSAPLVCGGSFVNIDPMAFDDAKSGRKYLYWGSGFQPIKVQELTADGLHFAPGSSPQNLVSPDGSPYQNLVEGAWLTERDGFYYLFYSGDDCCGSPANGLNAHYAVLVARSKSPTGPFESLKSSTHASSNVILTENGRWDGPGHNAVVRDAAGTDWLVYHAIDTSHRSDNGQNVRRPMLIDRIVYQNGWPTIAGGTPSTTSQPAPAR